MIDWLTLQVEATRLGPETVDHLRGQFARLIKIAPGGEIEWDRPAREVVRSDSHQIQVRLGSYFEICGSPARVMARDNVFGSGDVGRCSRAMLDFVASHLNVQLPDWRVFKCTRIDVTHNYDLLDLVNVRQALMSLRHAEGGRYQVRTMSESVYWSVGSAVKSGKAYAKGPHLQHLVKRGQLEIPFSDVELAARLLRLELSLRSQYWREHARKPWHDHSEAELDALHAAYFQPLIGKAEVLEMKDLKAALLAAAERVYPRKQPKESRSKRASKEHPQGLAAYKHWCVIADVGFEQAKALTPRASHYRYMKIFREAGLSWADMQQRNVVPLKRKPILIGEPVRSWEELRRAS